MVGWAKANGVLKRIWTAFGERHKVVNLDEVITRLRHEPLAAAILDFALVS